MPDINPTSTGQSPNPQMDSGQSPISPQIKVPPISVPPVSMMPPKPPTVPSVMPPTNLPLRTAPPFVPFSSSSQLPSASAIPPKPQMPSQQIPPRPPMPQAVPLTPPVPRPVTPISPTPLAPRPVVPTPTIKPIVPMRAPVAQTPPPPTNDTFKSSIRTMQEDIDALRKGQKPAGFQLEKAVDNEVKPTITGPQIILPLRPMTPEAKIELGKLERSKTIGGSVSTLPIFPVRPVPPLPSIPSSTASSISIPQGGRSGPFSLRSIFILIGAVVIIGAGVWFLLFRSSEPKVAYTPTPIETAIPSPTATPVTLTLEDYFTINSSVSFAVNSTFPTKFSTELKTAQTVSRPGDVGLFALYNPANKQKYGFSEFSAGVGIIPPKGIVVVVDDGSFYLTAVRKITGKDGYGFIVRLTGTIAISEILKTWENTMPNEFKTAFVFNPAKALEKQFSDNSYKGVVIRYVNFPGSDLTIDYAIITATNNQSYLVFSNSKEQMYVMVDKLTTSPVK